MAVKVDDRDGSVSPVDRSQQGKRDGMVAAERDDPGEGLALLRRPSLVGVGGGTPREDVEVTFLDLVQRPSVIIPTLSMSATRPHTECRPIWGGPTKLREYHHSRGR